MIRLIAADMDDTLLNSRGEMPERVAQSLKRAMAKGILVTLASGRMLPAMVKYEEALRVNAPMILFNGGVACEAFTHRPIIQHAVPRDIAREIARVCEEKGIYLQAYTMDRYYCEKKTDYTRGYEASCGVEAIATGCPLSRSIDFDPCKLLSISTPDEAKSLQKELSSLFPDTMNFMGSKPHYVEMVARGTDKGTTLAALAASLGIARDEVMAFGDGQNDITMLEYAGKGYAMGGSRAAAHPGLLVAPSADEAGVAQVIDSLLGSQA